MLKVAAKALSLFCLNLLATGAIGLCAGIIVRVTVASFQAGYDLTGGVIARIF